jgi:transposase
MKELTSDPRQAFPGQGQLKQEQEIDRLRREVAKLKVERDILKKAAAYFARSRCEVRLRREVLRNLAGAVALRGARCLAQWLPRLAYPVAQRSDTQR